jgi:hypothetical protein
MAHGGSVHRAGRSLHHRRGAHLDLPPPPSRPAAFPLGRFPVGSVPAGSSRVGPVPICWYGNQDASWVGYFDVLRRLGRATYPPGFDAWVALTRAGWWRPGEHECVLVERPSTLRVEPVPENWHAEIRLSTDSSAVVYRDGWSI